MSSVAEGTGSAVSPSLAFRGVMSRFASGVTLVCARQGEVVHGLTVSSFCSVSLDPPLILVCLRRDGYCHDFILQAGSFAVNVLAATQEDAARRFADVCLSPAQRFESLAYRAEATGAPVLADAVAWLDCRVSSVYPGGDHSIVVGEVLAAGQNGPHPPLVVYGRQYIPIG
ncbi:MAG TPA: flavin reductase family protein [Longimicrobium sp.]|nr:flavin reductase family protein [Longimicrobium sp.]